MTRVIFGHQDFAQTACPGSQVMARLDEITFAQEDDMANLETQLKVASWIAEWYAYALRGEPLPDGALKAKLKYLLA